MKTTKARSVALLILPVVMLVAIGFLLRGKKTDDTMQRLNTYTQTKSLRIAVTHHTVVGMSSNGLGFAGARNQIFYATWFDAKNTNWLHQCLVDENGDVGKSVSWQGKYVPNVAFRLSPQRLAELRQGFHQLPASKETPPLPRLLIVSFRFRDEVPWQTRIYDRSDLPSAMKQSLELSEIRNVETKH